jgi:SAM-dependent methyltransferase
MDRSSSRAVTLQIGLATFGILALELALIRWTSQQVPVFAYFNNLTLLAAFLGMGLGVALGTRRPELQHWTLPSLAVLCVPLALSEQLHLVHLKFPDVSLMLWGGESLTNVTAFVRNALIVLLLFGTIVEIFVCAGTVVGALFSRLRPLRAYSADLLGSLLGVIVMTVVSAFGAPPPIWLAVGALPFLYFSRRALSIMSFAAIVALSLISVGGAQYSPYYRIDLTRAEDFTGRPIQLSVNRDFHQFMQDLSPRGLNRPGLRPGESRMLGYFDQAYRLPFSLTNERESALVVGAGTGNDVAAALRSGFKRVVSVDIDPLIMKIGKELHPERPYDDPRATRVVNDARAYFEQNADKRFDVVCFGLLDSHAMFSAMSSLRLENYVYTRESIRSAWRLVKPGGVLTVSFSIYTGEWLSDRLYALVRDATGTPPLIVVLPMHYARMFVVGKQVEVGPMLARVPFGQLAPTSAVGWMRLPTDDWPFLYIRPKTFPAGYVAIIVGLILIAFVGARVVFGGVLFHREHFDIPLFLMGAAFLLIETRGVVNLSLLFGSTWIVNSSVFAGILLMAFLANLWVARFQPERLEVFFLLLFGAVLVTYVLPSTLLLNLPLWGRGVLGGLVNGLPIAFAGVIFSTLFSRSTNPALSLGSNLLGAVVGGCVEYLSMLAGLKALALVALMIYLAVFLVLKYNERAPRTEALKQQRTGIGGVIAAALLAGVAGIVVLAWIAASGSRSGNPEAQAERRWIRANHLADAKAKLQIFNSASTPVEVAQTCEDAERIDPNALSSAERNQCAQAHVATTRDLLNAGQTAQARRAFDRAKLELAGRPAELSELETSLKSAEESDRMKAKEK